MKILSAKLLITKAHILHSYRQCSHTADSGRIAESKNLAKTALSLVQPMSARQITIPHELQLATEFTIVDTGQGLSCAGIVPHDELRKVACGNGMLAPRFEHILVPL